MSRQAWFYRQGQWSQIEDPIDAAWPEDESAEREFERAIADAGYDPRFTRVLGPQTPDPIILFQATSSPQVVVYPYALELVGLNSERIYVADVPSLLEIASLVRGLDLHEYTFHSGPTG